MKTSSFDEHYALIHRFVELILRRKEDLTSRKFSSYTPEELADILHFLEIAGFEGCSIFNTPLKIDMFDEDRNRTGARTVNSSSCICAMWDNTLTTRHDATGWLNDVAEEIVRIRPANNHETLHEAAFKWLAVEVLRSRPLEPIVLSGIGETLMEVAPRLPDEDSFRGTGRFLLKHTRDTDSLFGKLVSKIGRHGPLCDGNVYLRFVTDDWSRIACEHGCFSVPLPRTVQTYAALRAWMKEHPID